MYSDRAVHLVLEQHQQGMPTIIKKAPTVVTTTQLRSTASIDPHGMGIWFHVRRWPAFAYVNRS